MTFKSFDALADLVTNGTVNGLVELVPMDFQIVLGRKFSLTIVTGISYLRRAVGILFVFF